MVFLENSHGGEQNSISAEKVSKSQGAGAISPKSYNIQEKMDRHHEAKPHGYQNHGGKFQVMVDGVTKMSGNLIGTFLENAQHLEPLKYMARGWNKISVKNSTHHLTLRYLLSIKNSHKKNYFPSNQEYNNMPNFEATSPISFNLNNRPSRVGESLEILQAISSRGGRCVRRIQNDMDFRDPEESILRRCGICSETEHSRLTCGNSHPHGNRLALHDGLLVILNGIGDAASKSGMLLSS
ncbi:hypothetical protein E3N88_07426 [Mikania micrantha]|uniref:Uncharacterized protein n=1 Tax=Mikania micrantha TaxID=192012 RepID=A0A5N6PTW4_9ASTR|nr:hypothetical protein E3N88_07426 [Mikania micrantha]